MLQDGDYEITFAFYASLLTSTLKGYIMLVENTPKGMKEADMEEKEQCPECEKHKHTPRDPQELRNLQSRINRIIGQLNGISKMLADNRYCGDVLTQIAATESALQSVGYQILKTHMETCVVEDIKNGKTGVVDETVELIKRLK